MMYVTCQCGNEVKAADHVAGTLRTCPACKEKIRFPKLDEARRIPATNAVALALAPQAAARAVLVPRPACSVATTGQQESPDTDSSRVASEGLVGCDATASHSAWPLSKKRFLVERVTFIAVASTIGGLVIGPQSDMPVIGIIAMAAFVVTGVYVTAKTFIGIGGFFETLPPGTIAQTFDWRKFLLEPLYFLGVTIAAFLFFGAVVIFRQYIWPIMKR